MTQDFTVLENKTIGRNLYKFRKIREKKAVEVAKYIGISEPAYMKYERGESKITIDLIQKAAEFLKVDPLHIVASSPENIIENVTNSPFAIHGTINIANEKQTELIIQLIKNMMTMNDEIMKFLKKK